jgi:uncharacterized FAD-dependent dehydrogenase
MKTEIYNYDVAILGAGPAGLFAAYKLHCLDEKLKIIIIDKGDLYENRDCPARKGIGGCKFCKNCKLISGEGGAGFFSDGKLVFTLDTGTNILYKKEEKRDILEEIGKFFIDFNGKSHLESTPESERIEEREKFKKVGLNLGFYPVWHIGTFALAKMMKKFLNYLHCQKNIYFEINTEVKKIEGWENEIKKVFINLRNKNVFERKTILTRNIVFAVGKEGSIQLARWLEGRGIKIQGNKCYFGVRIELPTRIFDKLMELSPNPKIHKFYPDGSEIKTHCFCKNGQILLLKYYGLPLVGGHTYKNRVLKAKEKQLTNFAILVGSELSYPELIFKSIEIMQKVQMMTGGYLLVQRLGDFILNKPSTSVILNDRIKNICRPGNISDLNLPFDFRAKFIDFISQMNKVIPGVLDENHLIYAPAIEWWMPKIETNAEMETKIEGIYVIGDGSGKTQGIVQSMATALLAARSIFNKYDEKTKEKILREGYTRGLQGYFGESISS